MQHSEMMRYQCCCRGLEVWRVTSTRTTLVLQRGNQPGQETFRQVIFPGAPWHSATIASGLKILKIHECPTFLKNYPCLPLPRTSLHVAKWCTIVFRWLKRKNRELQQQLEAERHLATVCALAARKSKKSIALAEALSHARALKYTDNSGR